MKLRCSLKKNPKAVRKQIKQRERFDESGRRSGANEVEWS